MIFLHDSSLCDAQETLRFLMASQRPGLREYHVIVLLLIIANQFAKVDGLAPSQSSTPTLTCIKCTEVLSRTFSNAEQKKQNFTKMEFSEESPSTAIVNPSTVTRSTKSANETKTATNGCSNERKSAECPRFVDKYSSFYLKVGTEKISNLIIWSWERLDYLEISKLFSTVV